MPEIEKKRRFQPTILLAAAFPAVATIVGPISGEWRVAEIALGITIGLVILARALR